MRVLLTGASGFVGMHTAHALAAAGHEIRVLARETSDLSGLDGLAYDRAIGDIRGVGLDHAAADTDAVIHLAALTSAPSAEAFAAANAEGTANVAHAAAEAGVARFLYVSSLAAAGPTLGSAPPQPDAPCRPVTTYGRTKAAGETAALAYADRMAVQVLRPPVVYGPRDNGLLPFFRFARFRVLPMLGRGRNRLSLIHGRDLAEACVAMIERPAAASPFFHIADAGGPYTWSDLGDAITAAFGHRVVKLPVPPLVFQGLGVASEGLGRVTGAAQMLTREKVVEMRQPAWIADSVALTAATGWAPRIPLHDGLVETIAWYRAHRLDLMPPDPAPHPTGDGAPFGVAGPRPTLSFDIDGVLATPPFNRNLTVNRNLHVPLADPSTVRHADAPSPLDRLLRATYYRVRYLGRAPRPGAREAVEAAAAAGYRLIALTGRSWLGRTSTERWLDVNGFLHHFDAVIMNDTGLPSARFKAHAAVRHGVVRHVEDDAATAALVARQGIAVDLIDWPRNRDLAFPPGVIRQASLSALADALRDAADPDAIPAQERPR